MYQVGQIVALKNYNEKLVIGRTGVVVGHAFQTDQKDVRPMLLVKLDRGDYLEEDADSSGSRVFVSVVVVDESSIVAWRRQS